MSVSRVSISVVYSPISMKSGMKVHIRWPYNYLLQAPMTEPSTHGLEPLERGMALVIIIPFDGHKRRS